MLAQKKGTGQSRSNLLYTLCFSRASKNKVAASIWIVGVHYDRPLRLPDVKTYEVTSTVHTCDQVRFDKEGGPNKPNDLLVLGCGLCWL